MAPHILDIEVVSAMHRLNAAGDIDDRRAALTLDDLGALRVMTVAHGPLLDRCWAVRGNLTAYDAVYVALAEVTGSALVTGDGRLARAPGIGCVVEVLGDEG